MINLRGSVLAIIDLAERLGLPSAPPNTTSVVVFGKGRHRAGLNIGDCFSYALASATEHPLLFKGDDFIHTDIRPALPDVAS